MNLSPLPVQKFFDNAGRPLSGGLLFTYVSGTSTKLATYTDASGGTPNTNPIVLDFRGEANIWLDQTLTYKFVLSPASDTDPPTNPIWSVDNISAGITFASLTQQIIGQILFPRTPAENSAGITPTNYYYLPGRPVYDVGRYGASTTETAANNSTAIQKAVDVAYAAGGGVVYVPAGTYAIDTPIVVWDKVSLVGDGLNSTFLHKTTATPSPISDNSVRFWDSATVGFPICAVHFVNHDTTSSWAYGICRGIGVKGDTTSPNTTTTEYGFFFRGIIVAQITDTFAEFVQVGYFWGAGTSIVSEVARNLAANVQRGFYQQFMTSTLMHDNYAINFRYAGYFLCWYYSVVCDNASDAGGTTWKVGTTEICLAYQGNACRGGEFTGNGCESHNGSVFKFSNCISVQFSANLGLLISSDYTGGSDICLWENDSNNSCVYVDNRIQTSAMTGTGARHFIYKITSELGTYVWQRNRFVASITDTTDTSTWTNISGTIVETQAVFVAASTFTPTIAGSGTAGTTTYGTRSGSYERIDNVVYFRLRVTWTAQTGAGNLVVGGLPYTSANTDDVPVNISADSLTFANQLTGMINKNATTIQPYTQSTGGALTAVPLDTAATLWISGSYLV